MENGVKHSSASVTNAFTVQDRYDQFQNEAVANIVRDFTRKPKGRFLLVIPTAGGKTFTAVKAVNRLFEEGVLKASQDRVLWTAHRTELLDQARETFQRFKSQYSDRPSFQNDIDLTMISQVEEFLRTHPSVKLVVIDEAHHAVLKNVNYRPIFLHTEFGILGLTATPSRHDGEPLDFERESFSIGFPDLVKKGIVLKPEVRKVPGGVFVIDNIDSDESLEQLNNRQRNDKIITELMAHSEEYKKVIIYVGTQNHVQSLYELLRASPLKDIYESISFITGGANSRQQERRQFLEQEKKCKRSILVNVLVLSEGYDDPSVNTAIMAAPSRSKLYYMQAMGRAIRHDPNDPLKRAFCVEIVDELPNIRYRIDNRWLYSDVSDTLEPAVIDRDYGSEEELAAALQEVFQTFGVSLEYQKIPVYDADQRYTMLLFKKYMAPNNYAHFPIVVSNDNRLRVSNMFNFLSERIASLEGRGVVAEQAFRMVGNDAFAILSTEKERRWVYEAMKSAIPRATSATQPKFIAEGYPWISFVAFHFRRKSVSAEILAFVKDMVNREQILGQIEFRNFERDSYLYRFPLPLKSYIGKIVTNTEHVVLDELIKNMRKLRNERGDRDHRKDLHALIDATIFPIELAFKDSIVLVARTDEPYCIQLN